MGATVKGTTDKTMTRKTANPTGRLDRINRRMLLKGAGGVALALPMLEAMQPRAAHGQGGGPTRFMFVYNPNGNIESRVTPSGSVRDFTLGQIHEPMNDFKQDIVVFNGINNISYSRSGGNAHPKGTSTLLTGFPNNRGGISLDQELAKHDQVVGQTAFRSLELGVHTVRGGDAGHISWAGSGNSVTRENNPGRVFDRLFRNGNGNGGGNEAEVERFKVERTSVLDFVKKDLTRTSSLVGMEDRQRLELHTTAVRDAELRLQTLSAVSCEAPDMPAAGGNIPATYKLQLDLMVLAASCDLTRVTTLMFGNGAHLEAYPWVDAGRHHALSHRGNNDANAQGALTRINTWHTENFAHLLANLNATKELGGSLMDNVLVLWMNELKAGNQHSADNIPTVVAGRAGGKIETGRFLNFPNKVSNQNLYVSVLQAMGVDTDTFGDPGTVDGPLQGLLS